MTDITKNVKYKFIIQHMSLRTDTKVKKPPKFIT